LLAHQGIVPFRGRRRTTQSANWTPTVIHRSTGTGATHCRIPLGACWPRSANRSPDSATMSRTVPDTVGLAPGRHHHGTGRLGARSLTGLYPPKPLLGIGGSAITTTTRTPGRRPFPQTASA
jgi:hypothetical protein